MTPKKSSTTQALPTNTFELIKGCLSMQTGVPIGYWPLEVSQFKLVILTDMALNTSNRLFITGADKRVPLAIKECIPNYSGTPFFMCTLQAMNRGSNVEQMLKQAPELLRWNSHSGHTEPLRLTGGQLFVRAARFDLMKPLFVSAKTFGTRVGYELKVKNVSKTGLLMEDCIDPAPFGESTIVELVIDPKTEHFAKPIACLAKVVRRDRNPAPNSPLKQFALQIIEIDTTSNSLWVEYVEAIERAHM